MNNNRNNLNNEVNINTINNFTRSPFNCSASNKFKTINNFKDRNNNSNINIGNNFNNYKSPMIFYIRNSVKKPSFLRNNNLINNSINIEYRNVQMTNLKPHLLTRTAKHSITNFKNINYNYNNNNEEIEEEEEEDYNSNPINTEANKTFFNKINNNFNKNCKINNYFNDQTSNYYNSLDQIPQIPDQILSNFPEDTFDNYNYIVDFLSEESKSLLKAQSELSNKKTLTIKLEELKKSIEFSEYSEVFNSIYNKEYSSSKEKEKNIKSKINSFYYIKENYYKLFNLIKNYPSHFDSISYKIKTLIEKIEDYKRTNINFGYNTIDNNSFRSLTPGKSINQIKNNNFDYEGRNNFEYMNTNLLNNNNQ